MIAVLAAVVSGCSSGSDGQRDLAADDGSEQSAVTSLAPRPAELDVADVEACDVFGADALDELEITKQPRPGTDDGNSTCLLSATGTDAAYDLLVTVWPDTGAEEWLDGSHARPQTLTAEPITVADFPAVRAHPADDDSAEECDVVADVAQQQAVGVRFATIDRGQFGQARACELAEQAAGLAVTELRSGA